MILDVKMWIVIFLLRTLFGGVNTRGLVFLDIGESAVRCRAFHGPACHIEDIRWLGKAFDRI